MRKAPRSTEIAEPESHLTLTEERLNDVCNKLSSLILQAHGATICLACEVGQVLRESCDGLSRQPSSVVGWQEATQFIEQVVERLRKNGLKVTERELETCTLIAARFNRATIEQIATAPWITTTHIGQIAHIEDDDRRQLLIDKVVAGSISTRELQREIKTLYGPRRASGGGRPPRQPANSLRAAEHVVGMTEQWLKLYDSCWFGTQFNLIDELRNVLPEGWDGSLRDTLEQAIDLLRKLAKQAGEAAAVLDAEHARLDALGAEQSPAVLTAT